jgi:hypothetical protein
VTLTPFGETLTASRTPLFTLSSLHPLSLLRNELTGAPTHTGAEYQILANQAIETAEIGRYMPGFSAEAGLGIRVGVLPGVGQTMRWGFFDSSDGFGWVLTATGLSTFVRRAGVDTLTAQANWNVDTMADDGPSDFTLDLAQGNIFEVRFTWYGFGQIQWSVIDTKLGTNAAQEVLTAHRSAPDGATSTANANLPIKAEVVGTGPGALYLAGRQFSVLGVYAPEIRSTSKARAVTGVTTAFTPIIAMRRRNDEDARRIKLRVQAIQISTSAPIEYALVQGATLLFGTPAPGILTTASQSAAEFSIDPSVFSIGTGQAIVAGVVSTAGQGGNASGASELPGLDLPLPRTRTLVLVARAITGTADITALLRSSEEW